MSVKWRCKSCGAMYDNKEALMMVLSNFYVPVEIEDKVEAPTMPRKPALREIPKPKVQPVEAEEEEEYEDLKL